ncbi:MAG: hypothetical protein K2G63_02235 [Oscillospiraceae bacterium]|nr:hypothetical protein [Oscillospiraceae bacterium]
MLFVQHLQLHYRKDMRYPNYAQVRNAFKFLPINPRPADFYPEEINYDTIFNCEVLFQRVFLSQENDGIKKQSEYFKKFNDEIFTVG